MKVIWQNVLAQSVVLFAASLCFAGEYRPEEFASERSPMMTLWEGDFSISPVFLFQMQFAPYVEQREECSGGVCENVSDAWIENHDPAHERGFRVRRARLGARGQLMDGVEYDFVTETAANSESGGPLLDAKLSFAPADFLKLSAGLGKVPFSRTQMISSSFLSFVERPISVESISPQRQLGLTVIATVPHIRDMVRFYTGIYNGERGASGNMDKGFLGAARIEMAPFGEIGHTEMDYNESPFPSLLLGFDGCQNNSATQFETAFSSDLTLKIMNFSLVGEYLWKEVEPIAQPVLPPATTGKVESHGWFAQASYYEGFTGLESILRFERFDPNIFLEDEWDTEAVTAGVNYYMYGHRMKLQLDYIWRNELYGRELANNVLVCQLQVSF